MPAHLNSRLEHSARCLGITLAYAHIQQLLVQPLRAHAVMLVTVCNYLSTINSFSGYGRCCMQLA